MRQFVVASSIFPKFVKLNIQLAETSLVHNFTDQLIKKLILTPYKTSHLTCWAFPNNPAFISVTQEDTGLKEGRFSLARSSQRTFPYDQKRIRRSSSLYTDSSENLSRNSSISMSTLISSLSVDLSRTELQRRSSKVLEKCSLKSLLLVRNLYYPSTHEVIR